LANKPPPRHAHTGGKTRQTHGKSKARLRRRSRLGRKSWLILVAGLLVLGVFGWTLLARQLAPTSNTSLTRFDAIIVLGAPSDSDGNPSPTQLARVTEAVHEYERGVAPRLIMSGAADRNRPIEATVMARTAEAQGIPASAIYVEGKAKDTIENGCYSVRIMERNGWHSAEVISSVSHLPRVGIIFSQLPLKWRTHAAPSLEPESTLHTRRLAALETLKTLRYLVWAQWTEECAP
jgi:uncharacterized SAM-binding protein YcdF (DUF218 family)